MLGLLCTLFLSLCIENLDAFPNFTIFICTKYVFQVDALDTISVSSNNSWTVLTINPISEDFTNQTPKIVFTRFVNLKDKFIFKEHQCLIWDALTEEIQPEAHWTQNSGPGVLLRIWLKQGKEKRLLARILIFFRESA